MFPYMCFKWFKDFFVIALPIEVHFLQSKKSLHELFQCYLSCSSIFRSIRFGSSSFVWLAKALFYSKSIL